MARALFPGGEGPPGAARRGDVLYEPADPGPRVDFITQRLLENYGARPHSVADFRGAGSRPGSRGSRGSSTGRPASQLAPGRRQTFSASLARTAGARPFLEEVDTRPLRPVSALAEAADCYTGRAHQVYLASREAGRKADGMVLEGVIASRIRSGARPVATTRPISGASLAGPGGRSPSSLDRSARAGAPARAASAPLAWGEGGASGLLGTTRDMRASLRGGRPESGEAEPDPSELLASRAPARLGADVGPGDSALRTYGARVWPVQRNVTADRVNEGMRALHVNSFRYSLSSLAPASRPALVNPALHLAGDVRPLTSILTPQMTLAASDLALRMQEMKLRCEGLDASRMTPDQRAELERRYAAFGTSSVGSVSRPQPRRRGKGSEAAREREEAAADALRQNRNHTLGADRSEADHARLRLSAKMALHDASAMREKLPVVFRPEGYSLRRGSASSGAGGTRDAREAREAREARGSNGPGGSGAVGTRPLRATVPFDGGLWASGASDRSDRPDRSDRRGRSERLDLSGPHNRQDFMHAAPLDSRAAFSRPQSFSERAELVDLGRSGGPNWAGYAAEPDPGAYAGIDAYDGPDYRAGDRLSASLGAPVSSRGYATPNGLPGQRKLY